jgi:hypothetical protein
LINPHPPDKFGSEAITPPSLNSKASAHFHAVLGSVAAIGAAPFIVAAAVAVERPPQGIREHPYFDEATKPRVVRSPDDFIFGVDWGEKGSGG